MEPEQKVKRKITEMLKSIKDCWYMMPIGSGFGKPGLDYVGWVNGVPFAIEAKREPEKGKLPGAQQDMSPRQKITADEMRDAGAIVFLVYDAGTLKEAETWLKSMSAHSTAK